MIPQEFGEVITPLTIVFEVYKFVSRREWNQTAQYLLEILQQETIISIIDQELLLTILDVGMWRDRQDLSSATWLRDLRKSKWSKTHG